MEKTMTENDCLLTCKIGPNKVIYLEMGGDLTVKHLEKVKNWTNDIRGAMVEVSLENKKKVLTLIDVTRIKSIDFSTIKEIQNVMHFNKNYATKTAVFGGNPVVMAITHSAIVLTRRFNMKLFPARDAALAWLLEEDDDKEKTDA